MTSGRATPGSHGERTAECACGLAFPGPWELIAHFLAVYPPGEDQPLDDKTHADVTSLATKLAEGPSEAWEFGTWARDPRKYRRLAASIAMRIATGELKPWASISHQQVRDTYGVSAHAVSYAVGELKARGILGNYGGRLNAVPKEWIRVPNARERQARILDLITAHVMNLEAELSALKAHAGTS
jgi:hypothetical protein